MEFVKTSGLELQQNIPNPWSTSTEIKYSLPYAEDVVLKVYNADGEFAFQMVEEGKKGSNSIFLSINDFEQEGIYCYELSHGLEHSVVKMILTN